MPSKGKASQELAKALSEIVANATEMEPAAIIARLDDIEARFLPAAGNSEHLQLETKRRIAEWKFKLLSERNLASDGVERLYSVVRGLGFTDLETEATIEIYLAQYLVRQSRAAGARSILESLRSKLGSSAAYKHLRQDTERLLSSLKER